VLRAPGDVSDLDGTSRLVNDAIHQSEHFLFNFAIEPLVALPQQRLLGIYAGREVRVARRCENEAVRDSGSFQALLQGCLKAAAYEENVKRNDQGRHVPLAEHEGVGLERVGDVYERGGPFRLAG
jgi:predicted GNAT family N-acyltransferase